MTPFRLLAGTMAAVLILMQNRSSDSLHFNFNENTSSSLAAGALSCRDFFQDKKLFTTAEEFKLGKVPVTDSTLSFSFQLADKTFMTIVNLANVTPGSVEAQSAKNYLLHRDQIYAARLKIFDEEHKDKIETALSIDETVKPRSFILMNTVYPILKEAATEFIGGARVVMAKTEKALLPFELGLDVERRQSGSFAAEIGALTAYTKDNPSRSVEVVNTAIKLAITYAHAEDVYVHTSKLHSRLYKKMNLNADDILALDDLNYILRFNANNWQTAELVTKPGMTGTK